MVVARPFCLRCPRCHEVMKTFTSIIFVEDYKVIVDGICCGAQITSGEMEVLSLFPSKGIVEVTH